jgi:hypothetical protein
MVHANSKVDASQDLIDIHDKDGLCNNLHIHTVHQKCQLLGQAYRYARLTMNQFAEYGIQDANFQDCCKKAIEVLGPLGISAATHEQTLMQWNQIFREQEKFPYPTSRTRLQPEFFERFPKAKESILEYAYENMADSLTTDFLRLYIVDTLIPELIQAANSVGSEEATFLQMLTDSPPSETTIWHWLKWFGFWYDGQKNVRCGWV